MNSTKNPRPNQNALYQALNIYRDAMRPFILFLSSPISDMPVPN